MKIAGRNNLNEFHEVCRLPRPNGEELALTMRPLPLGFSQRLRQRGIAPPSPPRRVARDSSGRAIRDESGLAVMVADEQDAEYGLALEAYHRRVAVLAVAESLQADAQIEFESGAPDGNAGWEAYADSLFAEMEESGFTAGDLVQLCTFVCRLSNLTGEHLTQAAASFSSVIREGPG
ncbi:MAG: hypothetical protein DWQ34_06115 [Planctomycetota bacterium]|nr:MAG: hypothetical protein DWQ29_23265 [Planctomycetota bacterium]REJ95475.1 MAG: hypothetical protein DWQ34_06115 [Planctomycetota bacterium]REK26530.1 MAG: hypothetical protein DWQ41_09705 [Planctomycetota bacterium]REK33983.1 MAG: hypothetical protein DWQ45_14260 [Planctomycetota bacterium]